MNDTAVQSAIAVTIRAMSEFADADVVINDWGILDQSSLAAPYVIITNAVNITSTKDSGDEQASYSVPVTLIERFTNWKESLDNLRTRREAIFNAYTGSGNARSANGLAGTNIRSVRTEGPIVEYYDRAIPAELQAVSLPVFLQQTMVLEVEEF